MPTWRTCSLTPAAGARAEALDLVAIVEERGATDDEQQRVALGDLRAQLGEAVQERERALPRLDAADGEHGQPVAEPQCRAIVGPLGAVAGARKRSQSTPLRTSRASTPNSSVSRSIHSSETQSTRSGMRIERSWQAMSEGEMKSST